MNDEFRIDESKIVVHGSDGPRRPGVLPTKEELLRICFDQEVHGFLQVDAYLMDGVEPAIQTNVVYGLMHDPNNPVSIQIAQGATERRGPPLAPRGHAGPGGGLAPPPGVGWRTQAEVPKGPAGLTSGWRLHVPRDPLDDRACADHNGPRGRTRYQTGEVEEVTEGVVCCSRRPRFKSRSDPVEDETEKGQTHGQRTITSQRG